MSKSTPVIFLNEYGMGWIAKDC